MELKVMDLLVMYNLETISEWCLSLTSTHGLSGTYGWANIKSCVWLSRSLGVIYHWKYQGLNLGHLKPNGTIELIVSCMQTATNDLGFVIIIFLLYNWDIDVDLEYSHYMTYTRIFSYYCICTSYESCTNNPGRTSKHLSHSLVLLYHIGLELGVGTAGG